MKRKNQSKGNLETKERLSLKYKREPEKIKCFNDADLCKSDSDESIEDTVTQFSVNNRANHRNRENNLDFSDNSGKKRNRKNSCNSSGKLKNPYNNFEKIDLKKHLCDFKILENETENIDPLKNIKNNKNKDLFNYQEYPKYPCDHSVMKQIDFDVKININNLFSNSNSCSISNDENISSNILKN